jgi:hypothetical protein
MVISQQPGGGIFIQVRIHSISLCSTPYMFSNYLCSLIAYFLYYMSGGMCYIAPNLGNGDKPAACGGMFIYR